MGLKKKSAGLVENAASSEDSSYFVDPHPKPYAQ